MSNNLTSQSLTGLFIGSLNEDQQFAFIEAGSLPIVDSNGVIVGVQLVGAPLVEGGVPVVWWTDENGFQCDQVQAFTGGTAVWVEN